MEVSFDNKTWTVEISFYENGNNRIDLISDDSTIEVSVDLPRVMPSLYVWLNPEKDVAIKALVEAGIVKVVGGTISSEHADADLAKILRFG